MLNGGLGELFVKENDTQGTLFKRFSYRLRKSQTIASPCSQSPCKSTGCYPQESCKKVHD